MKNGTTIRSILLIFAAIGFTFTAGNTVHEFGHVFADWLAGIPFADIRTVIHPFLSPHMVIEGGVPDSMMGWPDGAGPLANLVIGMLLFVVLWKCRNPFLFPFLLWGPLACVQEGLGQIVTVGSAGSDAARMVAAGFPEPLLIVICVGLIVFGFILFGLVIPVAGVSLEWSFFRRLGILLAGLLPWGILTFLVSLLAGTDQDVSRSYNVIGGFIAIAVIVSLMNYPIRLIKEKMGIDVDFRVGWNHFAAICGLKVVLVALELLFLN